MMNSNLKLRPMWMKYLNISFFGWNDNFKCLKCIVSLVQIFMIAFLLILYQNINDKNTSIIKLNGVWMTHENLIRGLL